MYKSHSMKSRNHVQLYAELQNIRSGNNNFSGQPDEVFYLPELYNPGKTETLPLQSNDFYGLNAAKVLNQDTTVFPVNNSGSWGFEIPVKKAARGNTAVRSFFNASLNKTAAHLSEIELSLDCHDVSNLQFSTQALKGLFFDMKMPAVYKLTVDMEELASGHQWQEVKNLLREIKKIIGQVVKHRMDPRD